MAKKARKQIGKKKSKKAVRTKKSKLVSKKSLRKKSTKKPAKKSTKPPSIGARLSSAYHAVIDTVTGTDALRNKLEPPGTSETQ